jgi:ornithine cyclodeaminase/alanine dehydrogenase-like protein (mu-crystallin family)
MTQPPNPNPVYISYLNRFDIEALALTDAEILAAIEGSLAMQGRGETVVEPRMHIEPRTGVEITLTDIMSKLVVDDWGQCKGGKFGSLRAHVDAGKLSEATLHAELGQIVAGLKPGRETRAETILLWHRGLSLSDIALGQAMLAKAARLGIGQRLRFA